MDDTCVELAVRSCLASFVEAREAIEATFRVSGAPAIVRAVLKGDAPREGRCNNGLDYFVHGIGYTVVFPSEGQAHIDGSDGGDLFSVYDVSFFLEPSGSDPLPSIEELEAELERLVESGVLRKVSAKKYLVPRS